VGELDLSSFEMGLPEFLAGWSGIDADQAKLVQTRFRSLNAGARFRHARRQAWEAVYPRSDKQSLLLGDIADIWVRVDEVIKSKPHLAPTREAVQAATTGFVVRKRISRTLHRELLRPFRRVM
jgi:hypothetical protein